MATFLELCNSVLSESGSAGGKTLASVNESATLSTRERQVRGWVIDAWNAIQLSREDWLFREGEFTGSVLKGSSRYTGASFDIERFGAFLWRINAVTLYDPDIGRSDESYLEPIRWGAYRSPWDFGVPTVTRPTVYSISPDGELCLGAEPDKVYSIRGLYLKSPQALVNNGDVPAMPAPYHSVIVDRALMLLHQHDEAIEPLAFVTRRYTESIGRLERSQGTMMQFGAALA